MTFIPARWRQLVIGLLLGLAVLLAHAGWLDAAGGHYTERGFQRALVTFAVTRGLNGVISIVQGTEFSLEPGGVGVNLAPGQVLDPVNDLVERFSWLMLASTTSLGMQRLLLDIFITPLVTWLLTFFAVAAFVSLVRLRGSRAGIVLLRLTLVLIVLRFAAPVSAMLGEGGYALFLSERYETASQSLEQVTEQIRETGRVSPAGEQGVMDRARQFYDAIAEFDGAAYARRFEQVAETAALDVINLTVVFLAQTLVFPLLFLWGVWLLLRALMRAQFPGIHAPAGGHTDASPGAAPGQ